MTTQLDLEAIEARANAATNGPWIEYGNGMDYSTVSYAPAWIDGKDSDGYAVRIAAVFDVSERDADFIAHAREDIPKLIAEVRRLREDLLCYGAHAPACMAGYYAYTGKNSYRHPEGPCSCGFDEAKK